MSNISLEHTSEEWDRKTILTNEMEVLGRTISGQLHEIFGSFFNKNSSLVTPLCKIPELPDGFKVRVEVILKSKIKEFKIKKGRNIGKKFAKYLIEDVHGNTGEMTVWADEYIRYGSILTDGAPVKAICRVSEYMGKKDLAIASFENISGKRI